jgi:hypothetical protein
MGPKNYILITKVQFNSSGNILDKLTDGTTLERQNDVTPIAAASDKTNIYALQQKAFAAMGSGSGMINSGNYTDYTYPQDLANYMTALNQIIKYNTGSVNNYIVMSASNTNINDIQASYNTLLDQRNEIQRMMNNINEVPGTLNADYSRQYTTGLYANTLVAILATSLLYLVFIQLK